MKAEGSLGEGRGEVGKIDRGRGRVKGKEERGRRRGWSQCGPNIWYI